MYHFSTAQDDTSFDNGMIETAREIDAKVELYNESGTKVTTFYPSDYIISFDIEKSGNSNFFGSVVGQKLSLKLVSNSTTITKGMALKPFIGLKSPSLLVPYQKFKIDEISKDEESGNLTITAYDVIYYSNNITVGSALAEIESEISVETITSYTLDYLLQKCAKEIGCPSVSNAYTASINGTDTALNKSVFTYSASNPINLDGTESIRDVLQWMADVSCSVMYIQNDGRLAYKRLKATDVTEKSIPKRDYLKLSTKTNKRFLGLCKVTELGDNIESKKTGTGTMFYIRNNPFIELLDGTTTASFLLTLRREIVSDTQNFDYTQFNIRWRGNPRIDFGDKISTIDKDGNGVVAFLLDEKLTYNGGLSSEVKWELASDLENTANSSTLGDVLNSTYAKVDKANKKVEIVASNVDLTNAALGDLEGQFSSWTLTTEGIQQIVSDTQQKVVELESDTTNAEAIKSLETRLTAIDQKADSINLSVQTIQNTGVDKITTSTGYTFDEEGLTVSKSTSDISTTITDDGMRVKRNGEDVLVANNQGVDAVNLHASTYLIVGSRSRFEDYDADGDEWTACFWIGG